MAWRRGTWVRTNSHRHGIAQHRGLFLPADMHVRGGSRCVEIMGPGEVAIFDEGTCVWLVAGWFGQDRGV